MAGIRLGTFTRITLLNAKCSQPYKVDIIFISMYKGGSGVLQRDGNLRS